MKVYETSQKTVNEEISQVDDIVLLESSNGEYSLINQGTGEVIFDYSKDKINLTPYLSYYYQLREKDGKTYIRLYDMHSKRIIIDNMVYIVGLFDDTYMILQDEHTQKYYLFNISNYRELPNIFEFEADKIEVLCAGNNSWGYFVTVTKNGKKAIGYIEKQNSAGIKLVTDYEYDDIEKSDSIIILTKDGCKSFINDISVSGKKKHKEKFIYKEITCKKIASLGNKFTVISGKKDDSTCDLYYTDSSSVSCLVDTIPCDNMTCEAVVKRIYYGRYSFLIKVEKDGKYGMIFKHHNYNLGKQKPYKTLIDTECDNIELLFQNDEQFVLLLTKGNKKYIQTYSTMGVELSTYKDIEEVEKIYFGDTCSFGKIKRKGKWEIIDFTNGEIIFSNINILQDPYVTSYDLGTLVFEEEGKICFFSPKKDSDGNNYSYTYSYDKYKDLGDGYFLVEKDGKWGIIKGFEKLIDPNYASIEIYNDKGQRVSSLSSEEDCLYFVLKNENGYIIKGYCPETDEIWDLNSNEEFTNVRFYKEIIATSNKNNINVFCYGCFGDNDEVSKTFPLGTVIQPVSVVNDQGESVEVYLIDGNYYRNNNGTFGITNCSTSLCAWFDEYEEAYIFVTASSKKELDEKCRIISETNPEEVRKTLVKLNERYKRS